MKIFLLVLFMVINPRFVLASVLEVLYVIDRHTEKPYVEITDAHWSKNGSQLIIDAHLARCAAPCGNIGIEVNGTPKKAIVPSREDGTFTVILPKDEVTTKTIRIDADSYADYFGGYLLGDEIAVPEFSNE